MSRPDKEKMSTASVNVLTDSVQMLSDGTLRHERLDRCPDTMGKPCRDLDMDQAGHGSLPHEALFRNRDAPCRSGPWDFGIEDDVSGLEKETFSLPTSSRRCWTVSSPESMAAPRRITNGATATRDVHEVVHAAW